MNAVEPISATTSFKIQVRTDMWRGTPSSTWDVDLVMSDFNGFLEGTGTQ